MPEYNSNPNQRSITVYKEPTDNEVKEHYYTRINLIALQKAMSTLSPKAFEMWMYFSKNADKHFFWLSKVDWMNWCNFKVSAYSQAFKELEDLGYLVKQSNKDNYYDFYEIPKEEQKIAITIHKE